MKKSIINQKFFTVLLILQAAAWLILTTASCSNDNDQSATDIVTITGVNDYLTASEMTEGLKTLETTIRVKMSHRVHDEAKVTCANCHHKSHNDERIKKCSYCHQGLEGAKHFHRFCIKCHTDTSSGPVRCNECHIEKEQKNTASDIEKIYGKTFVFDSKSHSIHQNARVDCNRCHHDSGTEQNKNKCEVCHVGKSKMVILHYFCKDCHKRKKGPVKCRECHIGVKSDYEQVKEIIPLEKTGHRLPQIQFNHKGHVEEYNTECIDCHHKGSTEKCSACHKKKDAGAVINLKASFHQQCHECHRRTEGPLACHKCHSERK